MIIQQYSLKISNAGVLPLPITQKTPEGIQGQIFAAGMAFLMTLFALFHSVARVIKKLPDMSDGDHRISDLTLNSVLKEEFRPPSPTPGFSEADLLSSVLKRLSEVEEKVDTLKAKPSEMPYEKEELLNAAVYRVDALEAELIATKKV